ncbi:MAG: hypothetical protein LBR25_05940 [Erysipelotrichaceae bacterium]|jgi:hypothetical protein|nr:hypothetical protein [Erysipelotrichaceae bacterium]
MTELDDIKRQQLLDDFGAKVAKARDLALMRAMWALEGSGSHSRNRAKEELDSLDEYQRAAVAQLVRASVQETLVAFLSLFDKNRESTRIVVKADNVSYDLNSIRLKMNQSYDELCEEWVRIFSEE